MGRRMAGKYLLGATGSLVSYIAGNHLLDGSKPLHVQPELQPRMEVAGVNILPAVAAFFKALPETTRYNLIAKMNQPKEDSVTDWFDHFGENPYKISEVVPEKVWSVEYSTEVFFNFDPQADVGLKMLGMDWSDEKTCARMMQAAEKDGRQASAQALKDIEKAMQVRSLIKEKGKTPETVKASGRNPMNMVVVRLNNGDVMLYCPTKVRGDGEFIKWLEGLGPVKWVVVGSSAHTLFIPKVFERYPSATYISSKDAWSKIKDLPIVKKEKPDFDYTNAQDLNRLNNLLKEEGVEFYFVDGDACTLALMAVAHKTALEVDIIYSRSDGGFLNYNKKDMMDPDDPNLYGLRLFKWGLASAPTSPNDALPPYRFWFMDPTNAMGALNMSRPKKDGSSCQDMAKSLRKVLAADFDRAAGVHFGQMSGEDFRRSIDANWNWLDGQSLIKEENK